MEKLSEEIVCYDKQPPVGDRKQAIPVLWPVFVWQVYAPSTTGKSSNIFERTILSLLSMRQGRRLDSRRIEELSQWMGLEADMVSYIIEQQLKPKGWLDPKTGGLTEEGHEAISVDRVDSDSLQSGYVFQDAVDGSMLPRYSTEFPIVEPENSESLEFSFSKATNWKWRPSIIKKGVRPSTPSATQLSSVMGAMRQAQHNAYLMGDEETRTTVGNTGEIDLASDEPTLVYLWVWVYSDAQKVWAVSDPFGLHPQVDWMRKKVESALDNSAHLSRKLGQLIGVEESVDAEKLAGLATARDEQARLEVLAEFGNADKVEGLVSLMHGWMHRRLEVETSESTDRFHDYRDLITQSSGIVELCLRYCLEKYPLRNLRIIPYRCSKDELRTLIRRTSPTLTREQLENVLTVESGKVFSTAKFKQGSFRRCMAAILISVPDYMKHPLTSFICDEPLFLESYELSHWRDKTAHSDSSFNISKDMSLKACDVADAFIKKFLEGLPNG